MTARLPARVGAPDADPAGDLIDLADSGRILRRRWRTVALATLLGALAAAAVLLWAPRRFVGAASVVVRSADDAGSSLLGRLGIPADMAPASLGGALKSPIETELQILGSRAVVDAAIDSLGLQTRVLAPAGTAPWRLLRPAPRPGPFRKATLRFERVDAGAYRVTGRGVDGEVAPGRPLPTPYGPIALADGALPPRFRVQLLDREDAHRYLAQRIEIGKAGGEVLRIGYAAPDSLSAAAVPNAILAAYLERRRTTDRGVNTHRAEFLQAQLDSVQGQLATAEQALRAFQESPRGVLDPEAVGKLELEAMGRVREQLAANEVEAGALDALLQQVADGRATPRELAGYPSLLRSPAINEIVGQLATLEAERTRLLERRTPADPEIVALTQSIEGLERQLVPLGRAYAGSLGRQRGDLARQAQLADGQLAALPASAQAYVRLRRDVTRLGQTALALQTQLLDARLAAVSEGGDTRALDRADPPKRPAFPRPVSTAAVGVGGGLVAGAVLVLVAGFLSPRVAGAEDAARATGLPAAELGRGSPLFHAVVGSAGAFAVVPVSPAADALAVARWLAPSRPSAGAPPATRALLPAAERTRAFTAVDGRGPGADVIEPGADAGELGDPATPAVLAPLASPQGAAAIRGGVAIVLAAPGGVTRAELDEAVAAVRLRGGEPIAVVLAPA